MSKPHVSRRAWLLTLIVTQFYLCAPGTALAGADQYKGRPLADALRALQAEGLRIVFSSEIVTSDLRVIAEPRSKRPIEILVELLKPHGLKVERGPGLLLLVVRVPPPARAEPHNVASRLTRLPSQRVIVAARSDAGYTEQVLVTADALNGPRSGVGAEMMLGPGDLSRSRAVLADDPVRAIHSLPRVAAADDFRSEFSVRGSAYRHIGIIVDGVAMPWLQHAAYGRDDVGSLAMFGSDVLEQATLQAGAYPQRDGDWLGAQLGMTVREGSRTETGLRASIGGVSAGMVAEGPLGGEQRGSWLIAGRHSYLDWPIKRRHSLDETVFGFGDVQAKVAYDVAARHKLSVSLLAGRSGVDGSDEQAPGRLANGRNHAGLLAVRWDATIAHDFRLSQQGSVAAQRFRNKFQTGEDAAGGDNSDVSYRIDMLRTVRGGLLEAGAQASRTNASRSVGNLDRTSYQRSAYVNFAWTPTPRLVLTPGLRVSSSSLASRPAVGRWILGQWSIYNGWTLNASAGVSHQFPDFTRPWTIGRPIAPLPERAAHAEVGVSQRLGRSIRWQASLFSRRESDVLVGPARLFDSVTMVEPFSTASGSSRGLELLLERRATKGLSGWAGYSYGTSRYTDSLRNETFWADFDQRHALNVHAHYAVTDRMSAAATFRAGSNFPLPGYFTARPDVASLFVVGGAARNAVRLPAYSRLDVRAERAFHVAARRVTMFFEVLNVLNHANLVAATGVIRRETGEAVGFTEPLLPRLPSAGLRIEF